MKLTINQIAGIAHELNRIYCIQLGDMSHPPWATAPKWQSESAIGGVQDIIDGKTRTFEDQHNAWMKWKTDDGWVYGEKKDPEAKTHPCIMAYDDLPETDRIKDELYRNTVMALLPLLVKE
jgi:hypothetical protein